MSFQLKGIKLKFMVFSVLLMLPHAAFSAAGDESLPVYDLTQCIAIALEESPTLAISAENTNIAGNGVRQAWGAFLPDLNLSRNSSKSDRTDFFVDSTGTKLEFVEKSSSTDYGLTSRWNLFGGLRKFGDLKAARNDLQAARSDQSYNRQTVIEKVAVAYINLMRNERLLDVAREARDLAARELEKSETYHRIGSAARSDVLQAKVRLGQTKLDEIRAQNSVEQSFADLSFAMNRPLAKRFRIESSLLDNRYQLQDLKSLYDEALAARPDLQSLAYKVAARKGDVTSAGSNLLPSVDLFWRFSHFAIESEFRFGAPEQQNISYGYSVNWNVFDRFQTIAGRSQAKARVRISEYNRDQKRLDIQLEVRQLYNNLIEAQERISLSLETIANAEEELRLAQERFKVGAGTTLDAITAQVNLATARGDEVQASSDYLIASLRLDRAVGRSLERLRK